MFKVISIGSPVWRPPSSHQSRRASRPPGSCSPLALLQNLHASSTCSRGILSTSNETSISTININIKKHHLYTCSSPCERPSPRPGSPESSTCDQFSLNELDLTSMCSSHNDSKTWQSCSQRTSIQPRGCRSARPSRTCFTGQGLAGMRSWGRMCCRRDH